MMTLDEIDPPRDFGNGAMQGGMGSGAGSLARPTTAKPTRPCPSTAVPAPLEKEAPRPGSAVPVNRGPDPLSQRRDRWCKLQLRPSKRFEQKSFDSFLQRQATQVEHRQQIACSHSTMTAAERLVARGLLDQNNRVASRLLLPRKANSKSFADFLSRQDAAAKNKVVRSRMGPTPSEIILPKVKQQVEGDFDAFLARQEVSQARALERCKTPLPSTNRGGSGDFEGFWQRQEASLAKWEDVIARTSEEMWAAAKPPDFMSLLCRGKT